MSGINGMLGNMLQNMDPQQAKAMLDQLDEEQKQQAIQWAVDEMVIPHLTEIRQRARSERPTEEVRRDIESLPKQEREELFYDTLDSLVATMVNCRENPRQGFEELKTMLRDPYTTESLLLIFENEDHIDAEYTETLKDFGVEHLRWVGAMVVPEMYDEREVESVLNTFEMSPEQHEGAPGG